MSSLSTEKTLLGLDKAEYLGTSTRTQKAMVSPKLAETFSVVTPAGEDATDWDKMQDQNASLLDHHRDASRQASTVYRSNKVKVKQTRRQLNRTANGLRLYYRGLKTQFEATYERDVAELVGLDAPPRRKALPFREQCVDVVGRVRNPAIVEQLGPRREGSSPLDLAALASELEERVRVLDAVLAALTETEKLRDESLVLRRQAEAQLRRVTVNIARIQEGYYRLVGMDELADRIRRSVRTRATRADLPAPDGGDGPAPDVPAPGDPGDPPPPPVAEPSV